MKHLTKKDLIKYGSFEEQADYHNSLRRINDPHINQFTKEHAEKIIQEIEDAIKARIDNTLKKGSDE